MMSTIYKGIQMSLESFQAPFGGVAIREPASGVTRSLPVFEGKGMAISIDEQAAQSLLELQHPKKKSTTDQYIFQRRNLVTEKASTRPSTQPQDDTSVNVVRDTPSPADAETRADTEKSNSEGDTEILNVDEERGEIVSNTVGLEERTVELDDGQAGSDPGKTPESRPPLDEDQAGSNLRQGHVALAGPNPEPMHEDFVAIVYPQVHESLKHTNEEHVHLENPFSLFGTLSSMKNLDDAFTFGDQFLNDKPTKEELGKANVEAEVESMVTVPIHQDSSSAPPLSTPIIDLTHPKPVSPSTAHVSALEQICANFEKKNKVQDQTTQALSSRIFMLENHDLYSKIDNYINETVKDVVNNALQAPVRERFRELSEFDMKEILYDWMFKSGSYQSQPEHSALYEALEASMDRENSSSKQKTNPQSEQHVDDIPILDDVHISEIEDTNAAHLPKIKTRPDWLKPVPKKERPKTPVPDWAVPLNDLPDIANNWDNAITNAYKDLEENKLIRKTGDMGSFIKWYCKQIGKSKLSKANLEGPAFKVVRPFHTNNISLQFHMEEYHLLLTYQIDLVNPKGNRVVPDVSKPLPLGGPPGDKDRRNALSISMLKAAYYPDFGLEELVPSLWIESEREYDISAAYVRSHLKFLSVISLKTFSRYCYTFLRVCKADYKEYKISKADFKNLHPNDFEDLYRLHLQGNLNHLSGADKVHLFNAVNLWIRNIVIRKRVKDLQLGIESY
ncbi:hypothetical protein Tco_1014528 [Tanacetum coccineum]